MSRPNATRLPMGISAFQHVYLEAADFEIEWSGGGWVIPMKRPIEFVGIGQRR